MKAFVFSLGVIKNFLTYIMTEKEGVEQKRVEKGLEHAEKKYK